MIADVRLREAVQRLLVALDDPKSCHTTPQPQIEALRANLAHARTLLARVKGSGE